MFVFLLFVTRWRCCICVDCPFVCMLCVVLYCFDYVGVRMCLCCLLCVLFFVLYVCCVFGLFACLCLLCFRLGSLCCCFVKRMVAFGVVFVVVWLWSGCCMCVRLYCVIRCVVFYGCVVLCVVYTCVLFCCCCVVVFLSFLLIEHAFVFFFVFVVLCVLYVCCLFIVCLLYVYTCVLFCLVRV